MRNSKGQFIKGTKLTEKQKKDISLKLKGRFVTQETREKLSKSNKGKKHNLKHSDEWKKNNSLRHKGKINSIETRRKMAISKLKKNNPNWKGGISTEYQLQRASMESKLWRESVFKRDNHTCIWCFKKGGWSKKEKRQIVLNADHIKSFLWYPELRFAIDNGRTLCEDCHKKTDTYGARSLKKPLELEGYLIKLEKECKINSNDGDQ